MYHFKKNAFPTQAPSRTDTTLSNTWKVMTNLDSILKSREFHKNIYFCFLEYAKAFDCVDHNKLWKILKGMGISDHLTCLLRNLYPRSGHWAPNLGPK